MLTAIKNFSREVIYCDCESFFQRRALLCPSLFFSFGFFAIYYSFFLIPVYGLDSTIVQVDLIAGSCILTCFFLSLGLSKKFQFNPILLLPSFGCFLGSLVFLTDSAFYQLKPHMWIYPQIVGIIYASSLASVRCNTVLAFVNVSAPLVLSTQYDHLDLTNLLETGALVYFSSIFGVYFAYRQTIEHRQIGQNLRLSDWFKNTAGLGTWRWNLRTNEVFFDQRYCEMLGHSPSEIDFSFQFWEENTHPEDQIIAKQKIEDYMAGRSSIFEAKFRMKHKDGHWVSILSRGAVFERTLKGEPILFWGTHVDVSQYESLSAENEKLRDLQSSIESMIKVGGWELDISDMSTSWTRGVYDIYGIDYNTPTDKITGISYYAEHERERIAECVQNCIEKGESFDEVFDFINESGKALKVRSIGKPIYGPHGVMRTVRGTFQDITEEVQLQNELELERNKLIQSSKLATLGEMAAGVAHEINNPLAIIAGHVSVISKKSSSQKINEQVDFFKSLNAIDDSVNRISKIVSGLKRFSKTSDGVELREVRLRILIDEVRDLVEIKSRVENVKVKFEIPDHADQIFLRLDKFLIQQVLVNLISNGIDANAEIDDSWVRLSYVGSEDLHCFHVADSGAGVPDDLKSKLFDPFFTTKSVGKGTGLGLSISKSIAEEHGGDLDYSKNSDGLSTFTLRIPKDLASKKVA